MVFSGTSSFRMNVCASPTTKSSRYSRRASVEYDSGDGGVASADNEGDVSDLRSSRYRLLDEHEREQEAANVKRMIQQLKVQRQSRFHPQSARTPRRSITASNRGAPSQNLASSNYSLRASATPTTDKQRRASSARSLLATSHSLHHSQSYDNNASTAARTGSKPRDLGTHPSSMTTTTASSARSKTEKSQHPQQDNCADSEPAVSLSKSTSFQKQVLNELQKLKQAQLTDLEAIQQLQREKERAERRARQLEEQFRSSKRSSISSYVSSASKHKSKTLVIDEPLSSDDEEDADRNNDSDLDLDGLGREEDAFGDESLPPPQYDDEGASGPLTSPLEGESDGDFLSSPELSPVKWTSSAEAPESLSPVFARSKSTRGFSFNDRHETGDEPRGRSSESRVLRPHSTHSQQPQAQRAKFVQTWDSSEDLGQKKPRSDPSGSQSPRRVSASGTTRKRSLSSSRCAPRRPSSGLAFVKGDESDIVSGSSQVRKSSSFFEEKQKAKEEEARIVAEAAEKLERAQRALPPKQLLERQEQSRVKKEAQLKLLERELNAELAKEKRVKARDVPISTYVVVAPVALLNSGGDENGVQPSTKAVFVTPEELETQRKERIRQRAQQLLESAELPPRMALGATQQIQSTTSGGPMAGVMSVKMKKQLAAAAEEEARQQRRKPKPVPNFEHLHAQWEKLMKVRKASTAGGVSDDTCETFTSDNNNTVCLEFFTSRTAKLDELRAKKAARRQKQLEREEQERRALRDAQVKLLEKTKATASRQQLANGGGNGNSSGTGSCSSSTKASKPTKADELRVKKVLERIAQSQKAQEKETLEAERRQQRMKLATKRVSVQVKASEKTRIEGRSDYVNISEIDQVAKQRAQEFKRSLKESIAQNKQRILGAVAAKPSLMERFATDLKREEHKKQALEAVVRNVFGKNLGVMKGILTDEEHELAQDIVAADGEHDGDGEDNEGTSSKSKKKKAAKKVKAEDEEEDGEEAEYSDA